MIREILNRDFVLERLAEVEAELGRLKGARSSRRGEGDPYEEFGLSSVDLAQAQEEATAALAREGNASSGQEGYDQPSSASARRGGADTPETLDSQGFFSRDADICNLQSALDEYLDTRAPDAERATSVSEGRRGDDDFVPVTDRTLGPLDPAPAGNRRVFDKFSITDIGWVSCKWAEARRLFSKRHGFSDEPASAQLGSRVRLVLVGDWASGIPRARNVAKRMRAVLEQGIAEGIQQQVIHLGDTYYSGWPSEYERRFLPHWPVEPHEANRIGSWSVNANHDMYSGGYGYYDTLLKDSRFAGHKGCSFFSLETPSFRILCLDTGWTEGALKEPQPAWVRAQCEAAAAKGQRVLLLSHHQLFSSYESQGKDLYTALGGVLEKRLVHAWIWGHEHRCMVYKPHQGLSYAACIGHGGVPVYMWHGEGDAYPGPGLYEDRRFIQHGLERWAYMGFSVLDLDGAAARIRYIDEDGNEHRADGIAG